MPKISLKKTLDKILSGVKRVPKALFKKRIAKKETYTKEIQNCVDLLDSIPPIIEHIPANNQKGIQREFLELQKSFTTLHRNFKTLSKEFDKRLEILVLKVRALKILALCQMSLAMHPNDANEQHSINDILNDLMQLNTNELDPTDINSQTLIKYKEELTNLEIKTNTHVEVNNIKLN